MPALNTEHILMLSSLDGGIEWPKLLGFVNTPDFETFELQGHFMMLITVLDVVCGFGCLSESMLVQDSTA